MSIVSDPSTPLCFRCRFSETQFHIQAIFRPVKTMMATKWYHEMYRKSAVSARSTATYPSGSHVRHTMFCYAVLISQLTGFGKVFQPLYVQFEISSRAIRVRTTLTTQCENCSFLLFTSLFRTLSFPLLIECSICKLCN